MSIVSSTENMKKVFSNYSCIQNADDDLEKLLINRHIAYSFGYNNCSGLFEFELPDFSNFTCICHNILTKYIGATWCHLNKSIYVTEENGMISVIDPETCDIKNLESSGLVEIIDLSYDPNSNALYGISISNFYKINMKNGSASLIGSMGTGTFMIKIDCDRRGNMYGVDLSFSSSSYYSINTSTGHATKIGNLGVCLRFPDPLVIDKDYDLLYIITFDYSSWEPILYIIDVTTGHIIYIGEPPPGVSVFTIPYFYIWNQPPNAPNIDGPKSGTVGVEYEYNFSISDPNDNEIYLRIDWGNGTSGLWQGPYNSNSTVNINNTWGQQGTYTIRAQAKDIFDAESGWGTLEVIIPKNKLTKNVLFRDLFKWFKLPFITSKIIFYFINSKNFIFRGR